ncbi:hypothetical protein H9P43_008811 [Blastocladiella emersonii ATCC 22665]|nr:hypothetical protein H9P43_008811 [Blastocladiella emersonii ATCC 22665]
MPTATQRATGADRRGNSLPVPAAAANSTAARSATNLAASGSLPHHAAAGFVLPESQKAQLALWLDAAHVTGRAMVQRGGGTPATPTAAAAAAGSGVSKPGTALPDGSGGTAKIRVQFNLPGATDEEDGGASLAASGTWASGGGASDSDSAVNWDAAYLSSPDSPDTALEAGIVHAAVHLVARMTPSAEPSVRTQCVSLLLRLAELLAAAPIADADLEPLKAKLVMEVQSPDPRAAVDLLLGAIGKHWALLAVAMVSGLATFLTHRESAVRAVCATALAQLLTLHQMRFEDADRIAVVWDLYFALTASSAAAASAFTARDGGGGAGGSGGPAGIAFTDRSDRHVLISALGALAPLYEGNSELVARIVDGLLRLDIKTKLERQKIQDTLLLLKDKLDMGAALVEQVRPEDDDGLDLVWWGAQSLAPAAPFPALLDVYLTSPQFAVRFGCALLLDSYCHSHPDRLIAYAAALTLGYYDRCVTVALVYRSLFASLGTSPKALAEAPAAICPVDLMERVATSLDYLPLHDRKPVLAFLDLWAPRMPFNQLVYQSLLSCLQTPLRSAALGTLAKMAAAITGSSPHQIQLLWRHIGRLPSSALGAPHTVFPSLAPHFRQFPDFYATLFDRILHGTPSARIAIYAFLGDMAGPAGSAADKAQAVGLLALALGDMDRAAMTRAVDALQTHRPALGAILGRLKDAHSARDRDAFSRLVAVWDELATSVADAALVGDWAFRDAAMDAVWEYYLAGQPDHAAAPSPDEYEFARALEFHCPCWLGLLLHRLAVAPPPIPRSDKRGTVPTLLTLRRRFHAGYMLTMVPLAGFPDAAVRRGACAALVACCFSGVLVVNATAKALIEYMTGVLANHKTWSYVCSALDMAGMLLRTKVPHVAQFLVHHFLGTALDWAVNNPHVTVRKAALDLVAVCCAVFPQGTNTKLAEVRDAVRQCCMDRDAEIALAGAKVWSCIFRILSESNAPDFVAYVKAEFATLQARNPAHIAADPLLQHLSHEERKRLVALHLEAVGMVRHPPLAPSIVQLCMSMLANPSTAYRQRALLSILSQYGVLKEVDRHVAGWACLPLAADRAPSVCLIMDAFFRGNYAAPGGAGVTRWFGDVQGGVMPHPDDATALAMATLDEVLEDRNVMSIAQQNRITATGISNDSETASFLESIMANVNTSAARVAHADRLMQLAERVPVLAGWVPDSAVAQVMYHLERETENPHLVDGALVVLAEFCCMHESTLAHVASLLLRHVMDMRGVAMDAMFRIAEHSSGAFRHVLHLLLGTMAASADLDPGILMCLRRLETFLFEVTPEKVHGLLTMLIPAITAPRHPLDTRVLVAELVADLLTEPAHAHDPDRAPMITAFFDAMYTLLSKEDAMASVYAILRRVTALFRPPAFAHPLFTHVQEKCLALIQDGNEAARLEAVDMISCAFLPEDDLAVCTLLLLADESPAVVAKTLSVLQPDPPGLAEQMRVQRPDLISRVVQLVFDPLQAGSGGGRRRERIVHGFAILGKLFRAADGDAAEPFQALLVQYLEVCAANATRLRALLFQEIAKSALALDEYSSIPLAQAVELGYVNTPAPAAPTAPTETNLAPPTESADSTAQQPTGPPPPPAMTIVNAVNESRLEPMEAKRLALTGGLADRQAELNYWVQAQIQLLAMLGAAKRPVDAAAVLLPHLHDEHRGVRAAAVAALLRIELDDETAAALLADTLESLQRDESAGVSQTPSVGAESGGRLFHRKLDLMRLAVGLQCKLGDGGGESRGAVLALLIRAWRDPIRAVRVAAIALVRHLGVRGDADPSTLVEAMGALVSRDDYPERAPLNALLTWVVLRAGGGAASGKE